MIQSSDHFFLVRPAAFGFNTETAASNSFQKQPEQNENIMNRVLSEFDAMVNILKSKNINAIIFEDTPQPVKPDAIFPNNWISMHADGKMILYPMHAHNRRLERRPDFIDHLQSHYNVSELIDLSDYEKEEKYLEGTGSIVFDHINKIAYACISPRTNEDLLNKVALLLGYKAISFYSFDELGKEIYHTNVVMCVGTGFVVICLDSVSSTFEKEKLTKLFKDSGLEIVAISTDQMNNFAGNMLELRNTDNKKFLAMSQTAYNSLKREQITTLEKYAELLPISIPTIEGIGGGSVRCMIAEIFSKPNRS